jgi:hypothetical protein
LEFIRITLMLDGVDEAIRSVAIKVALRKALVALDRRGASIH